jgi:hypothetical protein
MVATASNGSNRWRYPIYCHAVKQSEIAEKIMRNGWMASRPGVFSPLLRNDFYQPIVEHALHEVEGILGATGCIHREFGLYRSGQAGNIGGFGQPFPDEAGYGIHADVLARRNVHHHDFAIGLGHVAVMAAADLAIGVKQAWHHLMVMYWITVDKFGAVYRATCRSLQEFWQSMLQKANRGPGFGSSRLTGRIEQ